jgi:hypothetical protein
LSIKKQRCENIPAAPVPLPQEETAPGGKKAVMARNVISPKPDAKEAITIPIIL